MTEECKENSTQIQQKFKFYTKQQQKEIGTWIPKRNFWTKKKRTNVGDCCLVPNQACKCNKPEVKKQRRYQPTPCICQQQSHKYSFKGKTLKISQAIFIWIKGFIPVQTKNISADQRLQVSHICGRAVCCNPDHLVLEKERVNLDRKECHKKLKDKKKNYQCRNKEHVPKCIYCHDLWAVLIYCSVAG